MREVWIRGNPRPLIALGTILLIAAALVALPMLIPLGPPWSLVLRGICGTLAVLSGLFGIAALCMARQPRLAYEPGSLLVNLRPWRPVRVPVEIVECFFFGQAPGLLPTSGDEPIQTMTIITRLAEKAECWKHRQVDPRLGQWCDGYIIFRGTWCEPITPELLKSLNAKLVAAHRAQRQEQTQGAACPGS